MWLCYRSDCRELPRQSDETTSAYAARLEDAGDDEAFIRKGLAEHFGMNVDEMGAFFESFPAARLRHIALLLENAPNRTEYSLTDRSAHWLAVIFRTGATIRPLLPGQAGPAPVRSSSA